MIKLPDYTYRVTEVIRVVDGDTVDVMIDMGMYQYVRKRIRITQIDTEELRGGTAETKIEANLAKERMHELLQRGTVYLKTYMDAEGKYGRLLGDLYVLEDNGLIDISKTLVQEGYMKGDILLTEKAKENVVYVEYQL